LAALEVVAAKGVEGLTHGAVAAVAGIPLGSTTYHFASLDDLLAAAIVDRARQSRLPSDGPCSGAAMTCWPTSPTGASNGPADASKGRHEAMRHTALGFRDLINYRIRSPMHCGVLRL
jgi:AcrR family transcriptional regulator